MRGKQRFEKLLEPINIGSVKLRNRMVKTAAGTLFFFGNNGYVTERGKRYYEALARGGVGCVYVESPNIDEPLGLKKPGDFRIDEDKYIPGLKDLVDSIHKHGCPVFVQLYHAGPWHQRNMTGLTPVAASAHGEPEIPAFEVGGPCEVLSIEKIEILTVKFADAAMRAEKAGFDGVDINCAGSHLLNTFLSRYWNHRTDAYGHESIENRARFVVDIIKEIKKRLGQDFPVGIVMNGSEFNMGEKGLTIDETRQFAKMFETAGADSFHVRTLTHHFPAYYWPEQYFYPEPHDPLPSGMDWRHRGPGAFVPDASAIKEVVTKPVITVGRWDLDLGEKTIKEGKIDIIGFTRALQADPEMPTKVGEGRIEDIVPCTACLTCIEGHVRSEPIYCRINAFFGKEKEYNGYGRAAKKKKILVAGGGPAGMEAARVAALRGHDVVLYTKDSNLGGLMPMAALIKGNEVENLEDIIRYFNGQLKKLDVKVKTGKEVNIKLIEKINPDAVILATGGVATRTKIPGSDNKIVVSSTDLQNKLNLALKLTSPGALRKATKAWMPIGKRAVIIGADIKGCQLGEFLVKRGKQVTIVTEAMEEELGQGMTAFGKMTLLPWLAEKGVTILARVKYEEIIDNGLTVTTKDGKRETIEADSIVPVLPLAPETDLLQAVQGKVPEVYSVGSCKSPGLIVDAISHAMNEVISV